MANLSKVPPPWVRLFIIAPVVFVGAGVITILSPVLHLVLLILDLFDRKGFRFSRLGGLGIALCVVEFFGLILAFILWVGSGFGFFLKTERLRRAHNRAFGWYLEFMTRALRFYLGFDFTIPNTGRVDGPVLTLARHAGPGDAYLIARQIIRDYHRQLHILGTTKLLWDPFIDHMVRRMPTHFCDQNPVDPAADLAAISDMSATMPDDGVLVIFPEGGNWTPKRWEDSIERLESRGMHDRAVRAASMPNVLAPRSAGAIAAMSARKDLTVVFFAHVGLEDITGLKEMWTKVPLRRHVLGTYWAVPPDEVPQDRSETTDWLFDQWQKVDHWISEHRPETFEP